MPDERITVDHPLVHRPGVYFGMPDEEYHAALALSATGVKQLRLAPMEWWENSPLNPELDKVETEAMKIGKAFHARIVEGSTVFEQRYAAALEPHPDALRTVADLTEALARHLVKPPPRAVKADLVRLLLGLEPGALIWDEMVRQHAQKHENKVILDAPLIRRIERAAAMIEKHPSLARAFADGAPEVSVFWVNENGVPCKARFDYLKPRAIVDLKSFSLRGDAMVDKTIVRAVATYKYHIQAAFYLRAAAELPRLVAAGEVSGDHDPSFLREVVESDKTFMFVWQASGTPIVLGKVLGPGIVLEMGQYAVEEALERWAGAWIRWGTAEWNEIHEISRFDDSEFPPWIND